MTNEWLLWIEARKLRDRLADFVLFAFRNDASLNTTHRLCELLTRAEARQERRYHHAVKTDCAKGIKI